MSQYWDKKTGEFKGRPYGSQYHAVLQSGNIKLVKKNSKSSETLMETMTRGRVYALIDREKVKSIVYFDNKNRRSKQIDIADHLGMFPHVHHGYLHNEYSPNGKPTGLTPEEKRMVARVMGLWDDYLSRQ